MSARVRVFLYAADALSAAGAKTLLAREPTVELVGPEDIDRAQVALLISDSADEGACRLTRAIQRDGVPHVVLVASRFDEAGVVAAVAAGVSGFLRRSEATPARLVSVIHEAVEPGCRLPEGLLRRAGLVSRRIPEMVPEGAPRGAGSPERPADPAHPAREIPAPTAASEGEGLPSRLPEREIRVLRLVAHGFDTADIAEQLAYSESTIKGTLAKLMLRLGARNRSHAVAVAIRHGLI